MSKAPRPRPVRPFIKKGISINAERGTGINRGKKSIPPVIVFRHVAHEGVGTIGATLDRLGIPYRYIDIAKEPPFPPVQTLSGLLVMGGPMGVYEHDRYPFLKRELRYIRKTIEAGKPVLGICLGSQLIARALGARVYPGTKKEIGWDRIHLTSDGQRDPLMKGCPVSPWVFQWHGDTFDLPRGARRLATSALYKNQAFRFARHVYALQYHLEVDGPMIQDWLTLPGAEKELKTLGLGTGQKIKKELSRRLPGLQRIAEPFFTAWGNRLA